jgi:hypothetical protein
MPSICLAERKATPSDGETIPDLFVLRQIDAQASSENPAFRDVSGSILEFVFYHVNVFEPEVSGKDGEQ